MKTTYYLVHTGDNCQPSKLLFDFMYENDENKKIKQLSRLPEWIVKSLQTEFTTPYARAIVVPSSDKQMQKEAKQHGYADGIRIKVFLDTKKVEVVNEAEEGD